MGEFSHLRVGGSAAINLSYDGLRRRTAHVIQPGFDGDFGGGFGEITKAEEIGVCGRIDPDSGFQLGGHAGGLRRVEAGTRDLENAGELEIIAHNLSKEGSVGFHRVSGVCEVSDGDAGLVGIHTDRGTKPILPGRRLCGNGKYEENQERTSRPEP